METIMMLMKAALYFAAIAVGLFVLLFPVILDVYMRENMKVGALNYWLTFIEVICLLGVTTDYEGTMSTGVTEALGCLTIVLIVSGFLGRKRAKKLGLNKQMTFAVIMAQIMSPVSILAILLMIYVVFSDRKKKGDKK